MKSGNVILTLPTDGGLGNQLFCWAAAQTYCRLHNKKLILSESNKQSLKPFGVFYEDFAGLADVHGIVAKEFSIVRRAFHKLGYVIARFTPNSHFWTFYSSPGVGIPTDFINKVGLKYIRGYFHGSELTAMFEFTQAEIRSNNSSEKLSNLLSSISEASKSALHIRLGDYLNHINTIGMLSEDYYRRAISDLKIKNPSVNEIFVFSNDIEGARIFLGRIAEETRLTFVSNEGFSGPHEIMILLANASNLIIGNSSFAWWGARFGYSGKKNVFLPSVWYRSPSMYVEMSMPGWNKVNSKWYR